MEKKVIALHDLGFAAYLEESTLEVDADKYDVVVFELRKLKKRIERRQPKTVTRYDIKHLKSAMQGLCWNCSKPNENSTVEIICKKCKKKLLTRGYKRIRKLREEQRCITCGSLLSIESNGTRCPHCLDKWNILRKERRDSRKNHKLCTECSNPDILPHHNFCAPCYFKQKARDMFGTNDKWQELRDLWHKQDGICPYTNKKLVRGQDASLDHKYPRKRFPELMNDINNFEWVNRRINLMKNQRTPAEFIEYLQNIIDNYKIMDLDIVNNCKSMIENYNGSK